MAYFERLLTIGPLASEGQGDFTLWNNEELTVNTSHTLGTLFDQSKASIVSGGLVSTLNMYNTSDANLSGGSVSKLYSYNSSTPTISGGSIDYCVYSYDTSIVSMSDGSIDWALYSYDTSTVNISGGTIQSSLQTSGDSIANISGGSIGILHSYDTSTVNISGGQLAQTTGSILQASDTSTLKISGGSIGWLKASDTSNVTFIVQDFRLGDGLSLDEDRVLGIGLLSGEWYDGTRWTVNITENAAGATILATTPGPTDPVPPSADAGGPYTICAGDPLILSADNSTKGDDPIVSYLWDLDGDGVFETDAGDHGFFEVGYDYVEGLGLNAGAIYDIDLKVTDSEGLFDTASAILRIFPDPAEFGDSNIDGVVDEADLANLVAQFGGPPDADSADFNGDGWVDLADFAIMRGNFGAVLVSAPGSEMGTITPEPATLSLLAMGGLAMLRRRRK